LAHQTFVIFVEWCFHNTSIILSKTSYYIVHTVRYIGMAFGLQFVKNIYVVYNQIRLHRITTYLNRRTTKRLVYLVISLVYGNTQRLVVVIHLGTGESWWCRSGSVDFVSGVHCTSLFHVSSPHSQTTASAALPVQKKVWYVMLKAHSYIMTHFVNCA